MMTLPFESRMRMRADLEDCAGLLRQGSRSFHAASMVLPRAVRTPATALYAFCRLADDAVDLTDDHDAALVQLRTRLDAVYAGEPLGLAADRAFAHVVNHYGIPRALPDALIEGFLWDAQGRQYEQLADVEAYATRVAGSVGAMMALLMGVREPEVLARACDLGIAMQLSNIARDVGEDARIGRLYLPRAWLREQGVDPEAWLARPVYSPALGQVVRRLLRRADSLYARAATGIAALPRGCRPGMHAARLLYAGIGEQVERTGLDSVSRRAVVPAPRKAALVMRAMGAALVHMQCRPTPPVSSAAYIVRAAAAAPPLPRQLSLLAQFWQDFDDRVAWLVALFERLERRERLERYGI